MSENTLLRIFKKSLGGILQYFGHLTQRADSLEKTLKMG